jgi:hypothetical protein
MSSLRGMTSGPSATAGAEEDTGTTTKKRRFKLLEETAPAGNEPERPLAPDRFGSRPQQPMSGTQGGALPGFVKMLAAPLAVAAFMRILVISDYMKQPNIPFMPFMADQLGQLVVCICLIVICASAGNTRN